MTLKAWGKLPKITNTIFVDALKVKENILFPFKLPTISIWGFMPCINPEPRENP